MEEHEGTPMGKQFHLEYMNLNQECGKIVGRSKIWQFYIDDLKACFPHLPNDLDVDTLHRAVNTVQPSLIRVESDEATYNLHIMVRYELRKN